MKIVFVSDIHANLAALAALPDQDFVGRPFQGYDGPAFAIRLWDGWRWSSTIAEKPICTIVVNNGQALSVNTG